jgi:hypothetical protein
MRGPDRAQPSHIITMNLLRFDDVFNDIFITEQRPAIRNGAVVFGPSRATRPSFRVFLDQAGPVHRFCGQGRLEDAADAALQVGIEMKGLQGKMRSGVASGVIRQAVFACAKASTATFEQAVDEVAGACEREGLGYQRSAATKMLQLFPQYSSVSAIYDDMARRTLADLHVVEGRRLSKDFRLYLSLFEASLTMPLIATAQGAISMDDFWSHPQVRAALDKDGWLDGGSQPLAAFVKRRILDRVLWLMEIARPSSM